MKKNIIRPGGIHTDNSPVDQPENKIRFGLNTVDETDDGDSNSLSVEESNEECYQLPDSYVPLFSLYMSNGETLIFSVASDESSSEIGVADSDCNYTTLINADFGFTLNQGVDAIYRLRRGCERTIYWTDPIPRIMNIDGLEDYKDENGDWDIDKFRLFKIYSKIPSFDKFEINEEGLISPGSINFSVQYLDDDLNPTEWITTSRVVKIYNDSVSENFSEIRGSTNRKSDFQDFGITNKSVRLTLGNLDEDYPVYRIAIITADNGSGNITSVQYSSEIPTQVDVYNYTGQGTITGTLEEIQQFNNVIDTAKHIEQIDSKLTLHNTKGKQINYCNLQKYASRIKSDVSFKKVILNTISESNPKSPIAEIEGSGEMPGEIKSYGIVYIFEDNTTSPVYHIPGKAETYISRMSDDNKSQDVTYVDNSSCDDYWGVDSEGNELGNKTVRHHRFPLRSEVNKPLINTETNLNTQETGSSLYLEVGNDARTSSAFDNQEYFTVKVDYLVDGEEREYSLKIRKGDVPRRGKIKRTIIENTSNATVVAIYEDGVDYGTRGSAYEYDYSILTESDKRLNQKVFTTEIFGIEFSGIDLPDTQDTNGNKVIGYYIVDNEKTENQKTILDTGVIGSLTEQEYFVASGHISPELESTENIKKDVFSLIHPEHKFLNKEYKNVSEIIQEGQFNINSTYQRLMIQDVAAGTSYDSDVHKNSEDDGDGFSLHLMIRDGRATYQNNTGTFLSENEIDEIFYLDAVSSKVITDTDDERKEVFNVSGDNKIGIISANVKKENFDPNKLPYVVLKRNLSSPYSNFRYLPYYKMSKNPVYFEEGKSSSTKIFNGGIYTGAMNYVNSFYYNTIPVKRDDKSSLLNYIVGGLTIIAGALITIGTLGGGTALGVMVAGFGISQIASGLKKDKLIKVYNQLFDEGLRDCVVDDITESYFPLPEGENKLHYQDDDEIQWIGESINSLWFESSVNIGLRQGNTSNIADFLDAPENLSINRDIETRSDITGDNSGEVNMTGRRGSGERIELFYEPNTILQQYFLDKLTALDLDNDEGRLYRGHAVAEFYDFNKDYLRKNKEKIYNHLGIEYDCCSDCNEVFKHRNHWSETSFQEELTDNYRVFLPNNYRDIQGESGEINNVYKIQDNLYIHTTEALWHLPRNFQERVTGDILSFLGTGEFFNISPKKILDSSKSSAGTRHKRGTIKTKNGILFPSIDEYKWYLFTGNDLKPITDKDNSKWFLRNMPFAAEQEYFKSNKRPFPFSDNPSSKYGVGFLSAYDTDKERLILTKKDYSLQQYIQDKEDYEICENGGKLIMFENYKQTISDHEEQGFTFEGKQNCRLKFNKQYFETVTEEREIIKTVPNETDVHIMLDLSGSFGYYSDEPITEIRNAVDSWLNDFRQSNPDWKGDVYEYSDKSERWLAYAQKISKETYNGQNLSEKDIIVISFCNESSDYGNADGLQEDVPAPTQAYLNDFEDFKVLYNHYNSFIGIHYPIVFDRGTFSNQGKGLLQQSLAAIKGTTYTRSELRDVGYNEALNGKEWEKLRDSLMESNPYPDDGLENYGWVGKFTRNDIGGIIDSGTFATDINELLAGIETTEIIEVDVKVPRTIINYVDGIEIDDFIRADNSWTISYSLKKEEWRSWHSYLPNFYFDIPGKLFSWIYDNPFLWQHNVRGNYLTYYGKKYSHIIEYVSVSNPIQNRIWRDISFQTEAKKYFPELNEYNIVKNVTFNKVLLHNSRQISGLLEIEPKNNDLENYFDNAISFSPEKIYADNNEGDWYINDFRDMRVNSQIPMFNSSIMAIQNDYYTDKIMNDDVVDINKDWFEMESFRDKYLVIRLIFDTFDNVKLITKYSIENETPSNR